MRASELLGAPVVDADGRRLGVVHDLRARHTLDTGTETASGKFELTGIVIGPDGVRDRLAHRWGFAQGRADGPWPLGRLLDRAIARAVVVPTSAVASWDDGRLELRPEPEIVPLRGLVDERR